MSELEPSAPVDLKGYDFLDFGCSAGGSLDWAKNRFGGRRGLGIDRNAGKVAAARAAGYEVVEADAARLDQFSGKVRFSTMVHFLEHLPSIEAARTVVATAMSVSRDFLYIRQPWFDSDGDLMRRGLKLYWSHWLGHPLPMSSLQAWALFEELRAANRCARFAIYGRSPIRTSDDAAVLPLSAPRDSHHYEPKRDGPKPSVSLDGAYTELVVIAAPRKPECVEDGVAGDRLELLYDSAA